MFPSHSSFVHKNARRAFTLMELLVVIVIIGILAAIALPVMNTAKVKGLQIKCLNNLKQWGSAFLGYATDHNGEVSTTWASAGGDGGLNYDQYLSADRGAKSAVMNSNGAVKTATEYCRRCPAQPWDGVSQVPVGYIMVRGTPQISNYGIPLNRAAQSAQLMLMIDAIPNSGGWIGSPQDLIPNVKPICVKTAGTELRHGGGVNAVFGDGHTQQLMWSDLDPNNSNQTKAQQVTTWFTVF